MKKKINIYRNKMSKIEIENCKKVSVIVPNYNYANFITERIDSIIMQTYPIYELIILDDCSTDNSCEVIEEKIRNIKKENKNLKIKFIKNEKNSGGCVFRQWKKGFDAATGDFIWIAEADDSAENNFVEELMKGFDDPEVVLSYCESARIDENNILIREKSDDLYDMCRAGDWKKSYISDGKDEIINHLSVTNTILNVSSVMWRKKDYSDIFEKAGEYRVAGDWFIYYNILKDGKISWNCKPLNYYRKHGSSVCTDIKADIEFKEICKIQDQISDLYDLPKVIKEKQELRRSFMYPLLKNEENVKKKIAWIMPHPGKGSGGHRTIIQNVNALIEKGYICDIYVEENGISTNETVKKQINDYYGKCDAGVYVGIDMKKDYDLVFATGWTTTEFVKHIKAKDKGYFIQDFEPWFFAMGDQYLITENSYRYGFKCVTIGKWLAHKMSSEFGNPVQYFDFCADLNKYKRIENAKKENAICFIYQPEKPRRCDHIGLKALKIVKTVMPDLNIYLYGSNFPANFDFECKNLHIIPVEKCNELYNKCKVGICMSASNPSRIPFEMMAAGLPVVELYRENNIYDIPDGGALLAEPTPGAIASAIIKILKDEKLQKEMSDFGVEYMKNYPLEKGFEQFLDAVDKMLDKNYSCIPNIEKTYKKEAFRELDEIKAIADEITKPNIYIDNSSDFTKFRRRLKKIPSLVKSRLKKYINKFRRRK